MGFFGTNNQPEEDRPKTERSSGRYVDNSQYVTDTVMALRLNTSDVINKFENFLRGRTEIQKIDRITGQPYLDVKEGKSLMNEIGIQWVLGQFVMVVNSQVVQGNFDDMEYRDYLAKHHADLSRQLCMNHYDFDINEKKYGSVITQYMACVHAFVSRLKDNKERESYAQSMRSNEVLSTKSGGGWKIPFIS
jgi:hypothetical protein